MNTNMSVFEMNAGHPDIYKKIHESILAFPGHDSKWHAANVQIHVKDFTRIVDAINKYPNTFWGFGPFILNSSDNSWDIDYTKKGNDKNNMQLAQQNKVLQQRILTLENEVSRLESALKISQKYSRFNHVMSGWNGGVLHD